MTKNEIGRKIRLARYEIDQLKDYYNDPEYARLMQEAGARRSVLMEQRAAPVQALLDEIKRLEVEYRKPRKSCDFPAKAVAWLKANQHGDYPPYRLTWSDAEGDWVIITWPGHMAWAGRGETAYFETHHMLYTTREPRSAQPTFGQGRAATGRLTAEEKNRLISWIKFNVPKNSVGQPL